MPALSSEPIWSEILDALEAGRFQFAQDRFRGLLIQRPPSSPAYAQNLLDFLDAVIAASRPYGTEGRVLVLMAMREKLETLRVTGRYDEAFVQLETMNLSVSSGTDEDVAWQMEFEADGLLLLYTCRRSGELFTGSRAWIRRWGNDERAAAGTVVLVVWLGHFACHGVDPPVEESPRTMQQLRRTLSDEAPEHVMAAALKSSTRMVKVASSLGDRTAVFAVASEMETALPRLSDDSAALRLGSQLVNVAELLSGSDERIPGARARAVSVSQSVIDRFATDTSNSAQSAVGLALWEQYRALMGLGRQNEAQATVQLMFERAAWIESHIKDRMPGYLSAPEPKSEETRAFEAAMTLIHALMLAQIEGRETEGPALIEDLITGRGEDPAAAVAEVVRNAQIARDALRKNE